MNRDGPTNNAKLGFPPSQLDTVTRGLQDYVLIDPATGQIWSSYQDKARVHSAVTQAAEQFEQEATG